MNLWESEAFLSSHKSTIADNAKLLIKIKNDIWETSFNSTGTKPTCSEQTENWNKLNKNV